jgi:filamentous hemagglutinin
LNRSLASEAQMAEKGIPIAGKGAKTPLRKSEEMSKTYGGNASDYSKMKSSSYTANDGTKLETHYEKNNTTGGKFNIKTKINNEQKPVIEGTRFKEKLNKIN